MANEKLQEVKNRFEIVGNSPLLNRSMETAIKVSPTDLTVLIQGESGVGKENFSKIIHHLSRRKHNNFIAINCGAIPAGTIDSELFGHEKGSFTSAHEARKGYFETADGGTIFLDEIGELPFETQSRLLRILESGEFLKVGSSKVQKTDVRVITATNRNLYELSLNGKFREDLYYRLNTVSIKIPSLRERKEDIPFLFAKFASDAAEKYHMPPLELTPEAEEKLVSFPWPGNIRQLKNIIEQISILETNRKLTGDTVVRYLPEIPGSSMIISPENASHHSFQEKELLLKFLFEMRKELAELRTVVYEFMQNPTSNTGKKMEGHSVSPVIPVTYNDQRANIETEDTTYEDQGTVHQNLSLHFKEKELIRDALNRYKGNKGKRKLAAFDLGISERTLYRKIKEYELEEV